ncbi:MAG: RNA-binding S4 domain-containing protein [Lachnospiraceae bacterium]|nr:RNA-binding S4 domain-containing protein [Lachnospiraceae bacterium]
MSEILKIRLKGEYIRLGQALKVVNLAEDGVDAKYKIQDGLVRVNGDVDTRRGRKLYAGDEVSYEGNQIHIIG